MIKKNLISESNGTHPKEGDTVKVHIVGKLYADQKEFFNSRKNGKIAEFKVGKDQQDALNYAVKTMGIGEKAEFEVKAGYGFDDHGKEFSIPSDEDIVLEVELLDIVSNKDSKALAMEKALDQCERGNAAFRAGKIEEALDLYTDGRLTLMFDGKKDNDPNNQTMEYKKLNNRLNRNLAIAHARVGEYDHSLHYANEALEFESNDLKMLVRKLDAELHLQKLDDARQTYSRAEATSHGDPLLIPFRKELEKLEKEERIRQDKLFKKAFM